jgi:hypothetical protein
MLCRRFVAGVIFSARIECRKDEEGTSAGWGFIVVNTRANTCYQATGALERFIVDNFT